MKTKLKILPIGGLGEIGKNATLIMDGSDAFLIDAGMGFPGADDFIEDDFFIPDFDVIDELDITLHGVVITHGHEDHIGSLPYFLKKRNIPVFMTELPSMLLHERMGIVAPEAHSSFNIIKNRKKSFKIGPFTITYIPVPHSVPEANGLLIETPNYRLVHSGDFKLADASSPFGAIIGKKPVDILFVDSTNVEKTGRTGSEESIKENIQEIVKNATGRLIATMFSSNTERVKTIIEASLAAGRTVALLGRSINNYTTFAQKLGYLELPKSVITDPAKISSVPDNKLTIVATGSQAESRAVMNRISLDMFKSLTLKYGDTIFFSSKMIPGNELSISRMIDNLVERGATVYYENNAKIHVSGHAKQDEIIEVIKDVDPKLVVPVHGHFRFLDKMSQIAGGLGYDTRVISNGDVMVYSGKDHWLQHRIELFPVIVSNYRTDLVSIETIKERRRLARAGSMTVMMTVDFLNSTLLGPPRIVSQGIATREITKKLERSVVDAIYAHFSKLSDETDWLDTEEEIRIITRRLLTKKTKKKPIVFSLIVNLAH